MIGYRAWRVAGHRFDLMPLFRFAHYSWAPGLNVAACDTPRHPFEQSPATDCECGFWFRETMESCLRYLVVECRESSAAGLVVGRIETYGRHIRHENGIRCEKAAVACLYELVGDPRLLTGLRYATPKFIEIIAKAYDVPILTLHAEDYKDVLRGPGPWEKLIMRLFNR